MNRRARNLLTIEIVYLISKKCPVNLILIAIQVLIGVRLIFEPPAIEPMLAAAKPELMPG